MELKQVINYKELDPNDLEVVFVNNHVYFPRELRIDVLKKVINPKYVAEKSELEKIKLESPKSMTITQTFRLHRLDSFEHLSEFQLENDFIYYNDKSLTEMYLSLFWGKLTELLKTLTNANKIFSDISKLSNKDFEFMTICRYNQVFITRVIDKENYFDGITLIDAVKHFNETSSAPEITKLAKKYKLVLPKYWSKSDLQNRLRATLEARNELTPEMLKKVESSSVKVLQGLLDERKIDSKLHITKADMIKMIIKNVDKNHVTKISNDKTFRGEIICVGGPLLEEDPDKPVLPVETVKCKDEELLSAVISNQKTILNQNNEVAPNYKFSRWLSLFILIIIVVLVVTWVIYVINNV